MKQASSKPKNTNSFTNFFKSLKIKFKNKKFRTSVIASLILVISMVSVFGYVHTAFPSWTESVERFFTKEELILSQQRDYDLNKTSLAKVGYHGEIIGTVTRNIPKKTYNEGYATAYPIYSNTPYSVRDTVEKRNAIIKEAYDLVTTDTRIGNDGYGSTYKWIDEQGFLYKGTTSNPVPANNSQAQQRKLYKHTSANNMYKGNVSNNELGVIKKVTYAPQGYTGYMPTGLYAPAGEVIKVTIKRADMDATGGIIIHIGQALFNSKANNIWAARSDMIRFPIILNTLVLDKNTTVYDSNTDSYVGYIGSFIGGPIYIRTEGVTFSATISGAVTYHHFILGYTTEEEFNETLKTSAPYFDLWVTGYGALLSGPKFRASGYNYEQIYNVANYWEKVSNVSTMGSNQSIVMIFDNFVAAGAAVAFPGQYSINCPDSWFTDALNYNGLTTSGSWGNMHEYHHNFQGYGVGGGGEVTNNAMTLVSYALFTKISSKRGAAGYGTQNLGGWNNFTSATYTLNEVMKDNPNNGRNGLSLYATLLHNFGAENFMNAKLKQRSTGAYGENYSGYQRAWEDVTHNDMTYFFNVLLRQTAAGNTLVSNRPGSSMFVPVANLYQTGRSYMYDGTKKYIETMQPFTINYNQSLTINLAKYADNGANGSMVIPDGFTYTIKNVDTSNLTNGTFTKVNADSNDLRYTYTPTNTNIKTVKDLKSGKIIVTLAITKTDGAFLVDDVDLTLEFEQKNPGTIPTEKFETDFFTTRQYNYGSFDITYNNLTQSVAEQTNSSENYPLTNMFDKNTRNYASSNGVVNNNNKWVFTVDLGKEITANRVVITGANRNLTPNSFTLYVGNDIDNLTNVGSFNNVNIGNDCLVQFNFSDSKTLSFKYYRFEVRKAYGNKEAGIKDVTFINKTSGTAKYLSLEHSAVMLDKAEFKGVQKFSTFGHIYVSNKADKTDATITINYTGTRFAILGTENYRTNYSVSIDGVKTLSLALGAPSGAIYACYLSPELNNTQHTITITMPYGSAIDSILIW